MAHPGVRRIGSRATTAIALVASGMLASAAPVLASLEVLHRARLPRLRAKSVELTGFFARLVEARLKEKISIVSPAAPAERGCQLSLRIAGGASADRRIFDWLEMAGAICDWREPDLIRAAPTPLYNTFDEVYRFVELLERALTEGTQRR